MSLTVNTNMDALLIHDDLVNTDNALSTSMQRLSSGLRINSAADDPAGFAIANSFKASIAALQVASQNAGEAQSMVQTADGAYSQINDILVQMKSLATEAASGQTDGSDLTGEFTALRSEIDNIANSTQYGTTNLIGSTAAGVTFQVGAINTGSNQLYISFSSATSANLAGGLGSLDISTQGGAQTAMTTLENALTSINTFMGNVGAIQNQLQYTINNLTTTIENYTSSQSTIEDVDMASEVTAFTKNQILQQTGMAMLAQANTAPQAILTLLK